MISKLNAKAREKVRGRKRGGKGDRRQGRRRRKGERRYGDGGKGGDERRSDGEVKGKRKEGEAKGRGGEAARREGDEAQTVAAVVAIGRDSGNGGVGE